MSTNKINKKKSRLFLEEPNYTYRFFNKLNYYLIGGYNFNNNNSNLIMTLLIVLLLIGTYSILYTIVYYYSNYIRCEYKSPNCDDYIFRYV